MANINSVITYNANLSPAQAQIKALTGQVAGLTTAFNALDKSALKAQRSVAATFAANVGQIGGFTAQTVKATSAVETFGKQIAANKLTMREYFREAITGYTRQSSLMRQLAEQQVRYQQSVAVPIGGGQAMMLTPQSINAASSAAQLASQRFSIFNQLVNGGATAMLNWGKNTQWAGRQLMVGFTLPLALFAGAMSKQFRELDKELTRFQKVYGSDLGNAVSESTQRMRDQVQQLAYDISSTYGIAAKETAALAADIAATGAEGEQLMASIQQTTRLAVLGEVDRQEAMKTTLSLQSAFRMNTNELAESINFLNAVENQTSATLEDLATAIPKVGPVIRSLGGDVKDLATLLVAMREGGIPAAEAANALKSGLASLINPTKQASAVAKSFGVDLVGIVEANRGQLMPTIYAMQDALNGLDSFSRSRIIEQIFGKYQFARISALFDNIGRVGSQTQSVVELATKSSAELAAVANGEIRTLTESTAVKFQRTLEQLKNALMPIGQTLTETLIPILETVGKGIKMFSDFFSSLPESVKGLAKWGVALTALAGPVIMLVGLFGNLVANGLKFGMMIVRLGARMAGIKTEKFELLDEHLMAAKLGVDSLTSAFTTQEVAMKRLVGVLAAYEQSLGRLAVREPGLFVPGAVPVTRGAPPIRRQKGSTAPEKVPGGYGGGDRIPALLEPGESVITKEATAKFWPVIEAMNRGNLPGFNRGTIFLGMPRGYKDLQGAKQVKQTLSGTNIEATTGRFATLPVTDIGKKVTSIGGRSSSIPGMNGVYEEGGKKYVVKTHDTADSALAEVRGTQLTRDVFGLDTPVQELIKIKHPVTGDVIFAVRSPYDAKFASSTGVIDEKNFFGQALAAIVRRDKDLQPDNLYGNIVTDVGQAFVANKASQPRTIGGSMPSVAEQTETNFLMSKGGARKWFAESTAALAKRMPEDEYVKGFQTTIAEAARKARGAIDNLPYMTKEERVMYGRIIDDLDEAAKIDWRAVYQFHRGITPEVKRPPTAAALAKKEAQEAEKARQRGDMARWEYGLPYRFQKGGKVPGGYGGGDKVPAFLEPGEFVITKEATKLNKSFLEAINSGKTPGMYKTGKDSAAGSGQGSVGRAAKLHTVPPDELAKMYYGPGSKSMLGVLGYGGLTTTLHPQYINNTFDKLTGIPSWMKAGIPFNDRAAAQMLSVLIKERDLRGGKVGPEFTKSIQYLQKLIKTPGKARSITLNGYAATTAAAERLAGIIPDTDKAQKARAQQLAAELNKRVGTTTSPGRIFSAINRLSMEYIDKAIADPNRRNLIWESTPGTSKTKFKDSLRERLPRFAQSGFLFRGIRMGRFQKGGVGTGEPALLEPGEFVVNSDASAQYAPILRAMNRGTIGRYQDGKDDVTMRPGYNPNDPKYSSPDKTSTGGRHQGHIFGAPVAPGIPAFGKNLQIGGQAVFWHADFWKMITAAENQLANVLAMSAGNRARLMESLSIVGPQFNASQQQIDRIMLAVTNGFMQHEDDVTLYQAALRNLGQRISTGAASVTGSMAGLIKQVESIRITGYSAAEARTVEQRLIAEYQRILSTPGQLAETARIAIAKQLQIVQQQMAATGIATTQMTASLAANVQASAARPFPGGALVPAGTSPLAAATAAARTTGPSAQLATAEQNLIKAVQLRENIARRAAASEGLIENMNAERLRILSDTKLTDEKRRAILQQITSDLAAEEMNRDRLREAEQRADQNVITAKERAARAWGTTATNATASMTRPGGIYGPGGYDVFGTVGRTPPKTPDWLRSRMDQAAIMGPGVPTGIIPALGVMPTGPASSMQDPMQKMMRGQGLMNVAFMGSMAIGSLGALGVASEDAASKLMLLSTALMALPMLGMMSPKGMATNFMGMGSLANRAGARNLQRAGNLGATAAQAGAIRAAGMGSQLGMASRVLGVAGGPVGIAAGLGISAAIAGYMAYRNAAEEARERAVAAFNDPVKSAEYFGETIMNVSDILEKNRLSNISEDLQDVDQALRDAVSQDYAPLIEQIKFLSAGAGAQQLSIAYSNMIISGMSAENAKAAIEAIASEAGMSGGKAFSEAVSQGMLDEAVTIKEAVDNIVSQFRPGDTQFGNSGTSVLKTLESERAALEAERSDIESRITYGPAGTYGPPAQIMTPEDQQRLSDIANTIDAINDRIEDLLTVNPEMISGIMDSLVSAYQQDPTAAIDGLKEFTGIITSLGEGDQAAALTKMTEYLKNVYGEEWSSLGATIDTQEEKILALQMATAGISLDKAINDAGEFDVSLAQAVVTAKSLADATRLLRIEAEEEYFSMIDNFAQTQRDQINLNFENFSNAMETRIELYEDLKEGAQESFQAEQEARENSMEGMQDEIDQRRRAFDEEMQRLDDRKEAIEKSSEAYIKSLEKNQKADSFYAQQRQTSIGALQKLASGDVFGFLQDREQMSADAQEFSYDQMISGIEERRDLELDAIDEVRQQKEREQEEYEQMMEDRIQSVQDLMEIEQEAHDDRMEFYDKQIEGANTLREKRLEEKDKEIDGIKDIEGDYRTNSTKAEETYSKKYAELKTAPYVEARKEMLRLRIEEIYYRGGVTLATAAVRAGALSTQARGRSAAMGIEEVLKDLGFINRASDIYRTENVGDTGVGDTQAVRDMTVTADTVNITGDTGATGGYVSNGVIGLQSGGKVTGPGGPKSDVIPAMLSNGEYVIQASSVKKYGTDLMHTINAGKYATGGYVSADRAETAAQGNRYGGVPKPQYSGGTPTYSGGYTSANTQATKTSGYKPKVWKQPKIKTGGGFLGDMIFEGLRSDFADFINTTILGGQSNQLQNLVGMNLSGNRLYGQRSEVDRAIGNALFGLNFAPLPFIGAAAKMLSSFGKIGSSLGSRSSTILNRIPELPTSAFKAGRMHGFRSSQFEKQKKLWMNQSFPRMAVKKELESGKIYGSEYMSAETKAALLKSIPLTSRNPMLFHGSPNPVARFSTPTKYQLEKVQLGPYGIYNSDSLYATSTYARGATNYARPGSTPSVMMTNDPIRPLNLMPYGKKIPSEVLDAIDSRMSKNASLNKFSRQELDTLAKEWDRVGNSGVDRIHFINDLAERYVPEGMTVQDAQMSGLLQSIKNEIGQGILDSGRSSIRHLGGVIMGDRPHSVNILLDVEKYRYKPFYRFPKMEADSLMADGGLVQKFADGGLAESVNKWFPKGGHQFYSGWNRFNSWAGGKPQLVTMHHTALQPGVSQQTELDAFAKDWQGKPVVQSWIGKSGVAHTLAAGNTGFGHGDGTTKYMKGETELAKEIIDIVGHPNSTSWQMEVSSAGKTQDFTSGQFDAIARMTAAIRDWAGWPGFEGRIINHKDWAGYRTDGTARNDTLYPISTFVKNAEKIWEQGGGESPGNNNTSGNPGKTGETDPRGEKAEGGPGTESRSSGGKFLYGALSLLGSGSSGDNRRPGNNNGGGGGNQQADPSISKVISLAKQYSHLPYSRSAVVPVDDKGRPTGWGCATSLAWLYKNGAGVSLPHPSMSYYQYAGLKQNVSRSNMMPGDLIFYKNNGPSGVNKHLPVNHVEMSVGGGKVFNGGVGIQSGLSNHPIVGIKRVLPKYASGGFISGPGGPRSDVIPAMLSNGEYVVKASSVAKYGKGFMDQINAGQFGMGGLATTAPRMVSPAKYAGGGFVGSMPAATPTFGMPEMNDISPTDISANISNAFGGSNSSSTSNSSNVKVVINGAGGKSAKAIANRVISIINEANGRRNHSRSI